MSLHRERAKIGATKSSTELAGTGTSLVPELLLHGLERKGYLRSANERSGKSSRRVYRATPLGRKVLVAAREKVSELFGELLEDE